MRRRKDEFSLGGKLTNYLGEFFFKPSTARCDKMPLTGGKRDDT